MLHIDIPGSKGLNIEYLVLDYNGTIAVNGDILPGVKERINLLSKNLTIYVLTADTFGTARKACEDLKVNFVTLKEILGTKEKEEFVTNLGYENVASIGNGMNDHLMLKKSALGIAIIQNEGAAIKTILSADIAINSITDALDLFVYPTRLKATLRG